MTKPVFAFPDWPAPHNIRAAVSTRIGGVSQAGYAGFNMAAHVGDNPGSVAANRDILVQSLMLPEQPVWLTQVHGIAVLRHDGTDLAKASLEYDACYSNQPGKVCAVMTADCLPVLFSSQDGLEVAAAHAGWRGLVDGVLAATVGNFACPRSEILAWLGPAIGPANFEVGEDVYKRFLTQWQGYGEQPVKQCFMPQTKTHWLCDIYQLARLQLSALGVRAIFGGDEDTVAELQRYYSFRRDAITGRMASLVWRAG